MKIKKPKFADKDLQKAVDRINQQVNKCYNRKGQLISVYEWAELCMNKDYKILKRDIIGPYLISTVWLGRDHSFGCFFGQENDIDHIPIIFETMIFKDESGYEDIDMKRYSTEEEAFVGHEVMVKQVKEWIKDGHL